MGVGKQMLRRHRSKPSGAPSGIQFDSINNEELGREIDDWTSAPRQSTGEIVLELEFIDQVQLDFALASTSRQGLIYLVVRRGFGLVGEGGSASSDFVDDLVRGLGPDERLGVVVPV